MALPLGKLAIIIGAGIAGSVLAGEGRVSNVTDFVSGAFKVVLRQLKQEDSTKLVKKPHNDALLAQVDSLREQLQMLSSNRPITIISTSRTGGRSYGVIIIIMVVGSGYVWWKGWKLPDFMIATRRSLSDACNSVGTQLDSVYSAVSVTRRHLSSKINKLDSTLDEIEGHTLQTEKDACEIQEGAARIGKDVRSFRSAVETMESKISKIAGKQGVTIEGVKVLCDFAQQNLEDNKATEQTQALPPNPWRPLLEPASTPRKTASLPPALLLEPSPPSTSSGSNLAQRWDTSSLSGLKDIGVSNVTSSPKETETASSSSATLFGFRLWGSNALPRIIRSRSSTNAVPPSVTQD